MMPKPDVIMDPNVLVRQEKVRQLRAVSGRRRAPARLPVMLYPLPVERQYRSALLQYVDLMLELVRTTIYPALPALETEANASKPRVDAWSDEVDALTANLSISIDKQNTQDFTALTTDIGQKTSTWNSKQWQKTIRSAFGVNTLQSEPWLSDQLKSFQAENMALIKSIKDQSLGQLQGDIQRGFKGGKRSEDIAKQIEMLYGSTKSRAKLIARDQVSKLNGQLTELRQKDIGVTEYKWHTSQDERVRDSHKVKNGKVYKWSDPPADTGHPGNDYQCRCWAEAMLDKFYEEPAKPTPEPSPAPTLNTAERKAMVSDVSNTLVKIEKGGTPTGNSFKEFDHKGIAVQFTHADPDMPWIQARGKEFKYAQTPKHLYMQDGACHTNTGEMYLKYPKQYEVVTGFAYSDSGQLWARHSWLVNRTSGTIVETTPNFYGRYYGAKLTDAEATAWAKSPRPSTRPLNWFALPEAKPLAAVEEKIVKKVATAPKTPKAKPLAAAAKPPYKTNHVGWVQFKGETSWHNPAYLEKDPKTGFLRKPAPLKFKDTTVHRDIRKRIEKLSDQHWSSLTADQKDAIERYTGISYESVNSILRNNMRGLTPRYDKQISDIQKALSNKHVGEDILVYRGMSIDFMKMADPVKQLSNTVYTEKGFMSTSVNPSAAFVGGGEQKLKMILKVKKDTKGVFFVDKYSQSPKESEVLITNGKQIKLGKVTLEKEEYGQKYYIVEGEVL